MVVDEIHELLSMPVHTKRVGQAQSDEAAGGVRRTGRLDERLLGRRRIPEITLEVGHFRRLDHGGIDVRGRERCAGSEERQHRALSVGRNQHEATSSRRTVMTRRGVESDAGGPNVPFEHGSELVVAKLADVTGATAQRDQTDHRVRRRAARAFHRVGNQRVESSGLLGVDERHRTLGQAVLLQERVVRVGQDVDDGVADADYVEFGTGRVFAHRRWTPRGLGRRIIQRPAGAVLSFTGRGLTTSTTHCGRPLAGHTFDGDSHLWWGDTTGIRDADPLDPRETRGKGGRRPGP